MLYIMRHGTTDWNEQRRLQGRTDIPLNQSGRELARKAAEEYKNVHIDVCFCSPLMRAQETAHIFLKDRDVEFITDDRLMEMSFGIYEGTQLSKHEPGSPIDLFFHKPADYKGAEGGETFTELFARTGSFLKEAVQPRLEQGQDVLIVGHGAMNASIVCQRRNLPLEQYWDAGLEKCRLMEL